jgi:hypothetical protein
MAVIDLLALPPAVNARATKLGLELPPDMSYEQWLAVGVQLGHMAGVLAWAIGDWVAFGAAREHDLVEAAERCGLAFHTFETYASICRAFPASRRLEKLSFSHHQEVAGLPAAEADALLNWAAAGDENGVRRSTRALRERVQSLRAAAAPLPARAFPRLEYRPTANTLAIDLIVARKKITQLEGALAAYQSAAPSPQPRPQVETTDLRELSAFDRTIEQCCKILDEPNMNAVPLDERLRAARRLLEKLRLDDASLSLPGGSEHVH